MVRKRRMTAWERVDFLSDTEEKLSYRTDLKFNSGCYQVPRVLSSVRARIFAQVYGMHGLSSSDENNQTLFRWLFAHTGTSRSEFSPKYNHHQWSKIIRYYFQWIGHYAELALAEKLLFSLLISKKPTIIRDVFPADRNADRSMATDWMIHLELPKGQVNLGVQVVINNHIGHKINILLDRPVHDREYMVWASPLVRQFLRHNTAILSFPNFEPSDNILNKGRTTLLTGKTEYQFHHIRERFPDFENYGRWVGELFEVLHMGIKQRSIANNPYLSKLSYESATRTGNTVLVECDVIQEVPFVTLQFFKGKLDKYNSRVMTLIVPIHEDFLDLYRDMAGVRAI